MVVAVGDDTWAHDYGGGCFVVVVVVVAAVENLPSCG